MPTPPTQHGVGETLRLRVPYRRGRFCNLTLQELKWSPESSVDMATYAGLLGPDAHRDVEAIWRLSRIGD
jgi:hypothetical protein